MLDEEGEQSVEEEYETGSNEEDSNEDEEDSYESGKKRIQLGW